MQSLILAAGYATRLYPLTKNFPKPLLEIGGITILDRLIADLDKIEGITKHIVVTNHTFYSHFEQWKNHSDYKKGIVIIDDQTTNNETRLGAVRDILFVVEQLNIEDDLLILAGDNVVGFSMKGFIDFARNKQSSCITCHQEPSIDALRKTGVLETDESFKVLALHEKPQDPPSHWAVPPFYLYRTTDLPLIKQALEQGCGFDAPGNLAAWLCKKTTLYAWPLPGKRYDIGDLTSYEAVNKQFSK
jgi:glucose-1-phosphate thymidylyltransferase